MPLWQEQLLEGAKRERLAEVEAAQVGVMVAAVQTHRTQLVAGNPSGRCEWNFRCCFALELPTLYNDIKARCRIPRSYFTPELHAAQRSLTGMSSSEKCCAQVTVGDATKPLASRIWEHWMPFGTESEAEVVAIASARAPLADVLAAGSASGSWKHTRADKLGQVRSAKGPPCMPLSAQHLRCIRCTHGNAVP